MEVGNLAVEAANVIVDATELVRNITDSGKGKDGDAAGVFDAGNAPMGDATRINDAGNAAMGDIQ